MEEDESLPQPIRHSTTHPKYLHSNSTSHKWVFGAIAELVDNSVDAKASQFFVDVEDNPINPGDKLFTIRDNGSGMDTPHVHKMVSFGHCEKVDVGDGQAPIGHYGNGFKSGSMRIGRDAIVFTCDGKTRTVALLSQSYLSAIKAEEVLVPMASFNLGGKPTTANTEANISAITKYSPFTSMDEINKRFEAVGETGTYIVVFNLRRLEDSLELDFTSNQTDIRIKGANVHEDDTPTKGRRGVQVDTVPLEEYSLRAYLSILYMQPRMQLFIRGHRVYSRRLRNSLWKKEDFLYRPNSTGNNSHVYITFGFNTRNKQHMGCFIYHRNRLIKMYMRVGIQFASDSRGVGVIGVVDASFLTPTHNKQDFVQNNFLKLLTNTLKDRMKDYWVNCNIDVSNGGVGIANWWQLLAKAPNKDLRWRQCDNLSCLKWRKLDKGYNPEPYEEWKCNMHPHRKYNCDMPEIQPAYKIAPKRKREDLLEGLAKRPHLAPSPSPSLPSPSPSLSSQSHIATPIHFTPVSPSPMDVSQRFREQILQRQAGYQAQQGRLPLQQQQQQQRSDLGQQQRLQQQEQQIRERLAQHHQNHVKREPTASPYASSSRSSAPPASASASFASPIKQEPNARASHAVANVPAVINLDQHECKGCEAMCQKMTSLVNALGANISCEELHSSPNFDPQMFVFQIRDAFLHEIDTLKREVTALRTRNAALESGRLATLRADPASPARLAPTSATALPAPDLPTRKVYHMGVDSSSVETRYNTFLTNYKYIDSKLAKGSSPSPSPSPSPIILPPSSPTYNTPTKIHRTNSSSPITITEIDSPDSPTPSNITQNSTTTSTSTSDPNNSNHDSNNSINSNNNSKNSSESSDSNNLKDSGEKLQVGRMSMLDLLKKRFLPPGSSPPPLSLPKPFSTPTPTPTPPTPVISSPPTPTPTPTPSATSSTTSSSTPSTPNYTISAGSTGSRIKIQKVNVKPEPVDNLYQYAEQEAIHISSTQDSQPINQ